MLRRGGRSRPRRNTNFIPIYQESYQRVIPRARLPHCLAICWPLFDLMEDPHFRAALQALDGYTVDEMGKILYTLSDPKALMDTYLIPISRIGVNQD